MGVVDVGLAFKTSFLRHNPDQPSIINNRQTTDLLLLHDPFRIEDIGVTRDGNNVLGHYIPYQHKPS